MDYYTYGDLAEDVEDVEYIALSGGGTRGYAYFGVFQALKDMGVIERVKAWSGSSIGSVFALVGCLGIDFLKVKELIDNSPPGKIIPPNIVRHILFHIVQTFQNLGMCDHSAMSEAIESILKIGGFSKDCTFLELYEKTGKILVVTTTSISDNRAIYHNPFNSPKDKVIDMILASCSIPYIFRPFVTESRVLIDGGLYDNSPIRAFDYLSEYGDTLGYNRRALCFILVGEDCPTDFKSFTDITYFLSNTTNTINIRKHRRCLYSRDRIIFIDCKAASPIRDLTEEEKAQITECGYKTTFEFIKERDRLILEKGGYPLDIFVPSPDYLVLFGDHIDNSELVTTLAFSSEL